MQLRSDTIVALSTAPGRGAIALVRLSGPDAQDMARSACSRWPVRARECVLAEFLDPQTGDAIDSGLVTRFDAPHSYTGEPVVEFACHGGMSVSSALLATLVNLGARPAEPGEFTQRAVLNGKLDLLQAEAIGELVDARTSVHRGMALSQLHGGLSRLVGELREQVLDVEALLAYDVDFPEEDDGPIPRSRIHEAAASVRLRIEGLIATAPLVEVARNGALVVVAGVPNVGKSSLFNALLGEERAIVTPMPGTTRDAIEAQVERQPWPLRLVDTAGIHHTDDQVERLGIEASMRHLAAAHLVLACGDTPVALASGIEEVRGMTGAPVIPVLTKADLLPGPSPERSVAVSARTRQGLPELKGRIDLELSASLGSVPMDGAVLLRARHRRALEQAHTELSQFIEVWSTAELPPTIAAVHLRAATGALGDLFGSVETDEVMDRVFQSFCVGK